MDLLAPFISAIFALLGVALAALPLGKVMAIGAIIPALAALPPGVRVLVVLSVIAVVFLAGVLWYYWPEMKKNVDLMIFVIGLFLTMVFGMVVQVLAVNYRSGKPLSSVTGSQLIFPMLFCIVVFYPIWAVAASAPRGFFLVYTAFLNGYFWEHVVSAVRLPSPTNTT